MKNLLIDSGIDFDGNFIKLPSWCKRVRIDVGLSNAAPQSQKWLENTNDLVVFAFEPISENLKSIKLGVSSWPVKLDTTLINEKIFLIKCALSSKKSDLEVDFYVTESDPGCSSLYPPKEFKVKEIEKVQQWTLNHFLRYLPFDKLENKCVEFLKTDCQGADLEILHGASEYLTKIAVITCEAESDQYIGTSNELKKIKQFMKASGFFYVNWVRKLLPLYKHIRTDDPTFINKKKHRQVLSDKNEIYQSG